MLLRRRKGKGRGRTKLSPTTSEFVVIYTAVICRMWVGGLGVQQWKCIKKHGYHMSAVLSSSPYSSAAVVALAAAHS